MNNNINLSGTKFDCHRHTSFDPEKRAIQEKASYDSVMEEFKDAPPKMLKRLKIKYDIYLARKSRTFSSMITGAGNFPVVRHQKANESCDRSLTELSSYMSKIRNVMGKIEDKKIIDEAGGELQVAKNDLADLEFKLNFMKKYNKLLNSKPKYSMTDEKRKLLKDEFNLTDQQIDAMKDDYTRHQNFPQFAITNTRNRLKTAQRRVEKLEQRETNKNVESKVFDFDGGQVIVNFKENRIEIHNEEKPDGSIIHKYKSNGMKWSPFKKCWQRQLTNNALYTVGSLTGVEFFKKKQGKGIKLSNIGHHLIEKDGLSLIYVDDSTCFKVLFKSKNKNKVNDFMINNENSSLLDDDEEGFHYVCENQQFQVA